MTEVFKVMQSEQNPVKQLLRILLLPLDTIFHFYPTIKPAYEETLRQYEAETGLIVTVNDDDLRGVIVTFVYLICELAIDLGSKKIRSLLLEEDDEEKWKSMIKQVTENKQIMDNWENGIKKFYGDISRIIVQLRKNLKPEERTALPWMLKAMTKCVSMDCDEVTYDPKTEANTLKQCSVTGRIPNKGEKAYIVTYTIGETDAAAFQPTTNAPTKFLVAHAVGAFFLLVFFFS